jgi:S-formylglutathione hydrolase FrmB
MLAARIRSHLPIAVVIAILASLAGAAATPRTQPEASSKAGNRKGQVIYPSVPCPSLAGAVLPEGPTRKVAIYLPPSYETSKVRYPVIYFLQGFGDVVESLVVGHFQGFKLGEEMDAKVSAGAPEMIVVVVSGMNAMGGSCFANSPVTGHWEDFLARDLLSFVDKTYRTIASPGGRGIAGVSMGGTAALHLAMRHSDRFGSCYAMSPAVFGPSGLEDCGIFNDSNNSGYFSLEDLSILQSAESFSNYLSSAPKGTPSDQAFLFMLGYGCAFAPVPGGKPPFLVFPFRRGDSGPVRDDYAWKLWEAGFGGWEEKLKTGAKGLKKLRALGIEWDKSDETDWIPVGCRNLVVLMREAGVPVKAKEFDGTQQNGLGERLRIGMLPFFAEALAPKPGSPSPKAPGKAP